MIAIIEYDAGNLTSVERALKNLGLECAITKDPEVVERADRVIFPGVGAAGSAMESIKRNGMDKALKNTLDSGKPLLGICIGTQIIMSSSVENTTDCLGFIKGKTVMFPKKMEAEEGGFLKIPHMGWNSVIPKSGVVHPVLKGIKEEDEFYFVHSYFPEPENSFDVLAETEYGVRFASVVGRGNLIATQFHPEKSGNPGLRFLKNFAEWDPKKIENDDRAENDFVPNENAVSNFVASNKYVNTLSRRIIPCLDVREGRTTKGIKFKNNVDIGDPVEMAKLYYETGADEIVFYDITASHEKRNIMIDVVRRVAETIFIPFSVGGGIRTKEDMRDVLLAGAEKVSVNSAAVKNPGIISEGAKAFGNQCVVLGMDVKYVGEKQGIPSGYEIVINGGRTYMDIDALEWAKQGEDLGAGEICLNSIDADGTRDGYELNLTKMISENVSIPVIASGGAGKPIHLRDVLKDAKADAALIASMVHYGDYTMGGIKDYLDAEGVKVRKTW